MEAQIRRRGAFDESRVEQTPIDTRRFRSRLLSSLNDPSGLLIMLFACSGLLALSTVVPMLGALVAVPIYLMGRKFMHPKLILHNFPYRVPTHLKVPDGSKKDFTNKGAALDNLNMFKPEGVQYWGVSKENNLQVWASISDLKTHIAILGGTGSGKTELLYSMIINQLLQDSGFIFADAKGDISSQDRTLEYLRRFDRFEDLLTISFAAGNRDLSAAQPNRITNTFNIMSSSSDSMLIEIISGMVSSSETGADMWEGRCLAYVAAVTRPLVYIRNKGLIDLSASTYMEYMELAVVEDFVFGDHPEEAKGIEKTLDALKNFLISLPGYSPAKKGRQDQKTNEQFGYIAMQLTRVFNDLGYNYGHIFNASVGEIDISDVVLNRRCLTILLPSLERSSSTLTMLGKLIMGSIKQMMAGSLGADVEGPQRLIVEARPSKAVNVFRVILDEVGYIMVPGMSITTAQARSLNIAMTFAAQTFSDLKRGNAHEAEAIWDNTSLKLIGRLMGGEEHSSETWQKVLGLAGHAQEAVVSGYNKKVGILGTKFTSSEHISVQRTARIEVDYLRSLQDGEFILMGAKKIDGGKEGDNMIVPMNVLFAKSEIKNVEMRLNDLIPVSKAGSALDDTQAKQTLYNYLQEGSLLQQFQIMANNQSGSDSTETQNTLSDQLKNQFGALQEFIGICSRSIEEAKNTDVGLAVLFYKNMFGHVYSEPSDTASQEKILEETNLKAAPDNVSTSYTSSTDMFLNTVMDPQLMSKKAIMTENPDLGLNSAAALASEQIKEFVEENDTSIKTQSKRGQRTRTTGFGDGISD